MWFMIRFSSTKSYSNCLKKNLNYLFHKHSRQGRLKIAHIISTRIWLRRTSLKLLISSSGTKTNFVLLAFNSSLMRLNQLLFSKLGSFCNNSWATLKSVWPCFSKSDQSSQMSSFGWSRFRIVSMANKWKSLSRNTLRISCRWIQNRPWN